MSMVRYQRNRVGPSFGHRVAYTAGRLARRGVGYGLQRLGSYATKRFFSGSGEKKRVVTASTTEQRDFTNLYRRRRAPRRVRTRARRSFRRFMYNIDRTQGMQICMVNNYDLVTTSPSGSDTAQAVFTTTMYGCDNSLTTTLNNNDLFRVFQTHFGAIPTAADGLGKLRFRSCTMDFAMRNASETACYIEVYNVQNSRADDLGNPGDRWAASAAAMSSPASGAVVTPSFFKATPFDAPGFGSYWKVTNRKRYFLEAGQGISFQVRDAKNYVIDGARLVARPTSSGVASTSLPGVTEGVMFVMYGAEFSTSSTPANQSYPNAVSVDVSCVKTYHFYETTDADAGGGQFTS